MTYKAMCEYICLVFKKHDPDFDKTWEDIWNISPTGELFPIYDLFQIAKQLESSE